MKLTILFLILLLTPIVLAQTMFNPDIKFKEFNNTVETRYYKSMFNAGNDTSINFTADECRDICYNNTLLTTTNSFNILMVCMAIATFCMLGLFYTRFLTKDTYKQITYMYIITGVGVLFVLYGFVQLFLS